MDTNNNNNNSNLLLLTRSNNLQFNSSRSSHLLYHSQLEINRGFNNLQILWLSLKLSNLLCTRFLSLSEKHLNILWLKANKNINNHNNNYSKKLLHPNNPLFSNLVQVRTNVLVLFMEIILYYNQLLMEIPKELPT